MSTFSLQDLINMARSKGKPSVLLTLHQAECYAHKASVVAYYEAREAELCRREREAAQVLLDAQRFAFCRAAAASDGTDFDAIVDAEMAKPSAS